MVAEHGERGQPKRLTLRARPELRRDLKLAGRLGLSLSEFYAHPDAEDWIADDELERDTCQFHGGPRSECGDDERDWFPQLSICQPSMQLEAAKRRFERLHQDRPYHDGTMTLWAKDSSDAFPFHYADGVSVWMAPVDLGLGGDFLEQGSVAEQSPGEQKQSAD